MTKFDVGLRTRNAQRKNVVEKFVLLTTLETAPHFMTIYVSCDSNEMEVFMKN